MNILLFGANGQVGWELQRSLAVVGELTACDRKTVDFTYLENLRTVVREHRPDIIVNAAAYTQVDKAEAEPGLARLVNADAVEILAATAKHLNAWLIHYSTDYVFDGEKPSCYVETDQPNPLNIYGKTKYQGEIAIRDSGCNYLIFRTSGVYAAQGRANFPKTIIRLAKQQNELKVVADQIGAPTSAALVADVTAFSCYRLANNKAELPAGIYHLTSTGYTSWYEFAKYLLTEVRKQGISLSVAAENICPINTEEYDSAVLRPKNARLATKKLTGTFGIKLPSWQSQVQRFVTQLT